MLLNLSTDYCIFFFVNSSLYFSREFTNSFSFCAGKRLIISEMQCLWVLLLSY